MCVKLDNLHCYCAVDVGDNVLKIKIRRGESIIIFQFTNRKSHAIFQLVSKFLHSYLHFSPVPNVLFNLAKSVTDENGHWKERDANIRVALKPHKHEETAKRRIKYRH
jgi:predicted rRNA methylase YqxC with S4 and FtsJ domains